MLLKLTYHDGRLAWLLIQWAGPFHFAVLLRARVPVDDSEQTAPTLVQSAWGYQCTTRENAGCEYQSYIRMVMAHCSQHRCKGDDENIPLCTSASVLATAALPLIWIEASQSEYGWRWPLIGCQWLCSASHWLIGSMCSFVKASIRNIGEMEDWANEGNQNQNWDRFHLL